MKTMALSINIKLCLIMFFTLYGVHIDMFSQTTYTSSPSVSSDTSCPTYDVPSSCTSGTFLGNTIKFRLVEITNTNFVFRATKCDGSAFSQGGTGFIKESSVCGVVRGNDNINSGNTTSTVSIPIPSGFDSGTKHYYFTLNSDNGQRFHGGFVSITAVTPPPYLEFVNCISAPSQVEQGTDLDFDFSLEVFNDDLNYFINALLVDENNASNHQQLSNTFRLFTFCLLYTSPSPRDRG